MSPEYITETAQRRRRKLAVITAQWLDQNNNANERQRKDMFETWSFIDNQLIEIINGINSEAISL